MNSIRLWTRRSILLGCIAIGCALLPAMAATVSNIAPPRLVCKEPVYLFGTASNQTSVTHTFLLSNEGAETARIVRVASSCGCVVPELDLKDVPPGGQTRVRATFSLAGRTGHQRRAIHVMGTDPTNPLLVLWLEGDITRCVFDPDLINFGTVLPTDVSTRTARLTGLSATCRLTQVVIDNAAFRAAITEDGHGVVIHMQPPLPDGVSQGTVTALTDSSNTPVVHLPVTAMVVPAVRVTPPTISLPRDTPYATRTVWIRPGRAGAFTIRDVQSPDSSITPLLTHIGSSIYRLDLKNIPVSDKLRGKSITLQTSLTNMPTIAIPFQFEN